MILRNPTSRCSGLFPAYEGCEGAERTRTAECDVTPDPYVRFRAVAVVLTVAALVLMGLSLAVNVPRAGGAGAHYEQVRRIICVTFGPECRKAQRVAWCESRFNVHAVGNRHGADPYFGLFQFGSYARRTYGFAWDARTQARAAKRMRDREGWRPWPVCGRA